MINTSILLPDKTLLKDLSNIRKTQIFILTVNSFLFGILFTLLFFYLYFLH